MALKDFKKIDFKDKDTAKLQENIAVFLNQLNVAILDGVILSDISIGTTTTEIPHTLGREYLGWQLLDIQTGAIVWRDITSSANKTKFISLKASAAVTVSLWVY